MKHTQPVFHDLNIQVVSIGWTTHFFPVLNKEGQGNLHVYLEGLTVKTI